MSPLRLVTTNPDETNNAEILNRLLEQGKYGRALPIAQRMALRYPDNPSYPLAVATCQTHLGKLRPVLGVLRKAHARFPNHVDILTNLGAAHQALRDYENAEECFRKLLKVVPVAQKSQRAAAHTALGKSLWQQHKREDALEAWRHALEEDPLYDEAQQQLRECTNEYGEAKAPNKTFDDVYHFTNIHRQRYFQLTRKDGFSTLEEAHTVIGAIQQAWNTHITDWRTRLDSMTPAEKTSLFESVSVDFNARFVPRPIEDPTALSFDKRTVVQKKDTPVTSKEEETLAELDRIFPFLPSGGIMVLPFAVPALVAFGLKEHRLTKLFEGARPTRREEEALIWGHDIVATILSALDSSNKEEEIEFMMEARDIAGYMLEDEAATEVVLVTRKLLKQELGKVRRQGKKKRG